MTDQVRSRDDFNKLRSEIDEMNTQIGDLNAALDKMNGEMRESTPLALPDILAQIELTNGYIAANQAKLENWNKLLDESNLRIHQSIFLEEENERLQGEIDALKDRQNELLQKKDLLSDGDILYIDRQNRPREAAWVVDVDKDEITVIPIASTLGSESHTFKTGETDMSSSFLDWADGRNRNSEYFVLMVRPEGINLYEPLKKSIQQKGFRVGVDFIGQSQKLLLKESQEQ